MVDKKVTIPVVDRSVRVVAGTRSEIVEAFRKSGADKFELKDGTIGEVGMLSNDKSTNILLYILFVHDEYDTAVIAHECIHLVCRLQWLMDSSRCVSIPRETEELFARYFECVYRTVKHAIKADIDLSCQEHEERDRARELRRKTKAGKGFDSMGSQSGTVTT